MKLSLGLTPRDYSVAGGTVVYDTDAQAYFTANTAITSSADKNAINTFYLGLKSDGIYTKIKSMYLPIWGSAAACKWNLVNPLDTNAAFRLTFSTGWTFSSGGMTPLNAYANTNLIPSVILSLNSTHLSYYSRTNSINTGLIGSQTTGGGDAIQLAMGSNFIGGRINDNTYSQSAVTNTQAFMMLNRNSSTSKKFWRNAVSYSYTITSTSRPNQTILLGAYNNNGGITNYDDRQCAFASIGDGLTDTEATNFYNRVQTLMTYFGINV